MPRKSRYEGWRPKGSTLRKREREDNEAKAWYKTNREEVGIHIDESRPAERPRERVVQSSGRRRDRVVSLGPGHEETDDVRYDESARFVPIMGREYELDWGRVELNARVEHVLSFLPEAQRDLLWAYYIEHLPWQELRNRKESKQAVFGRLERARLSFMRAFIAHAEDPIIITAEDV